MKTIGLIGGMSWESSAEYYRLINQQTKRRLGGHHNAPSILVTLDFDGVERLRLLFQVSRQLSMQEPFGTVDLLGEDADFRVLLRITVCRRGFAGGQLAAKRAQIVGGRGHRRVMADGLFMGTELRHRLHDDALTSKRPGQGLGRRGRIILLDGQDRGQHRLVTAGNAIEVGQHARFR